MVDPDPSREQLFFRLGFVLVLVSGAMGFTVGSKATESVDLGVFGLTVIVPPGPGLATASMVLAASVLGALFSASVIVADGHGADD